MEDEKSARDHVFLVRMWASDRPGDRSAWRGSIKHVGSGRVMYVSGLTAVMEFMWTELAGETAAGRPRP